MSVTWRTWSMGLMLWGGLLPALASPDLEQLEQRLRAGDANVRVDIDALLQQYPNNLQLQFLKARWLSKQGQIDAAIALYQKLIKQQPNSPEPYNNLATLQAKQGDLNAAQQTLESAMKTHPSYAAVAQNLSTVYVELARDSYGKALKLQQQSKTVQLAELDRLVPTPEVKPIAAVNVATNATLPPPRPASVEAAPAVKPKPKPKPKPEPKPEPEPEPVAGDVAVVTPVPKSVAPAKPVETFNREAIVTLLQGWAAAWAGRKPELYFDFYTKHFSPPGLTRKDWEAQRRERLTSPNWIKVELSDFAIKPLSSKQVRARFVQVYESDEYADRIRKEVILEQTMDGWRIVAERKVAAL